MKLPAITSESGKDAVRAGGELEGIRFIRAGDVWIKKHMRIVKMDIFGVE